MWIDPRFQQNPALMMFKKSHIDPKLIDLVSVTEQEIDDKTAEYKDNHIERLSQGTCNATVGTLFMELLTNLERIADHSTNIAFSMYPKKAKIPARIMIK